MRFGSAYGEAEAVRGRLGERPNAYPEPYQYIRKMACSFGWDWGPTLVTAGIWKPVRLERWSTARIARVRPVVTVEQGVGRVELHVDVERTRVEAGLTLDATGRRCPGARATIDGTSGVVRLEVPDADLWWPRGYGEQPLYDVELWLATRTPAGRLAAPDRLPDRRAGPRGPTSTAPASPSSSTASGSSRGASTGSRTTSSRPGSPASGTAPG